MQSIQLHLLRHIHKTRPGIMYPLALCVLADLEEVFQDEPISMDGCSPVLASGTKVLHCCEVCLAANRSVGQELGSGVGWDRGCAPYGMGWWGEPSASIEAVQPGAWHWQHCAAARVFESACSASTSHAAAVSTKKRAAWQMELSSATTPDAQLRLQRILQCPPHGAQVYPQSMFGAYLHRSLGRLVALDAHLSEQIMCLEYMVLKYADTAGVVAFHWFDKDDGELFREATD